MTQSKDFFEIYDFWGCLMLYRLVYIKNVSQYLFKYCEIIYNESMDSGEFWRHANKKWMWIKSSIINESTF